MHPDALAKTQLPPLSRAAFLVRLAGGVVLVNLFVIVLVGLSIHQSHRQYQERADITTRNLAQVLDSEIAGYLQTDDVALCAVIDEYRRQLAAAGVDGKALNAYMERLRARLPEIDALRITDADGVLAYGNDVAPGARTSLADRPHFRRLRADPRAGLVISRPQVSRINGKWVIVLARRIDRPDGAFGGMAFAAIALEHLSRTFATLNVGPRGIVTLRDSELGIVVRHPEPQGIGSVVGQKTAPAPLREMVEGARAFGTYQARSTVDGIERLFSYRRVADYPLIVIVGLATADYLAEWRSEAAKQAALAVLFALITLSAAWLIYRIWRRQVLSVAALRASENRHRLLVENSPFCIHEIDMAGRITSMNRAGLVMMGVADEAAVCGRPYLGAVAAADRARIGALLDKAYAGEMCAFEFAASGPETQVFKSCFAPIKNERGTVTRVMGITEDVTARKQVEAELRIAATAFESQEGMVVTDAANVILRVNQAFSDITGYAAAEVVGRRTDLLKSGRHDAAFYAAMWQGLRATGSWQGEIWNRRKNGEVYPEWLTITAVKSAAGEVTHYVATLTDITLRKAAEDEIKHLAFYDPLTRLPNRRLLLDRLQQALAASSRSGREGALLFIDLDNFKTLNDTRGHDIGDRLLQQVGQRLSNCIREHDTVARLGGDEFVVMLEDLSGKLGDAATQAEVVGEKILAALNQPYLLGDHQHHSTPSIGITLFNDHQNSIDELLKRADLAMYQAKAAGRNTLRFFDPEMQAAVTARANLEADLRRSLHQGALLLYYQAQVDEAGRMTGAEALVRWQHPQRGLMSPADFIPLAEDTGLILPLGHWVLETACRQLVAWAAQPAMAAITLAVNVSARQFHHPDFVDQVEAVLDETGADPRKLKLELTESLLLDDVADIIAKMGMLKARGVGFSLDDFGTGYSSLSYLKRLPLDQLKIDQSFVRDILTDSNDAAIARTIVALAQSMGLEVIAEGVETTAQRDFLAQQSCHAFQGYLFGRPLPVDEFMRFIDRRDGAW